MIYDRNKVIKKEDVARSAAPPELPVDYQSSLSVCARVVFNLTAVSGN